MEKLFNLLKRSLENVSPADIEKSKDQEVQKDVLNVQKDQEVQKDVLNVQKDEEVSITCRRNEFFQTTHTEKSFLNHLLNKT